MEAWGTIRQKEKHCCTSSFNAHGQKCTMDMETSKQIGKYLCIFISDSLS